MKNSIFISMLFLFMTSHFVKVSDAQWLSDVRLSSGNGGTVSLNNNARCIASNGSTIHIVWTDSRGSGYNQICYKRSTDNGLTWSADVIFTNGTWYFTGWPTITVSGSIVNVSWVYNHNAQNVLYTKRSTDGGVTWGANNIVSSAYYQSEFPEIAGSGTLLFIIHYQQTNHLYYYRSLNGGASWDAAVQLTDPSFWSYRPSVSVSDSNNVHAVWVDERFGFPAIYYKGSTDAGTNWSTDFKLANSTDTTGYPCVASQGTFVHAVWQDRRDGNWEIYYRRSSDNGISWGAETRLTINAASSQNPFIYCSGQNIHVVWQDFRDGNWEIYYKNSTNGGITWGADTRLTNEPALSICPSISVSGTALNLMWTDARDGGNSIYYKSNPTGNPLGIQNINTEIPKMFNLYQNYPNPFNPSTKIRFDIPANTGNQIVSLKIYDITGRIVAEPVKQGLKPGTYEMEWDALNFTSGVYFYKITSGEFSETKKLILLK